MSRRQAKHFEKMRRKAAHRSMLAMREMQRAFRQMWHWQALRDQARRS